MVEPAANGSVRGRILVADDEPQVRRLLTTLLEAASFVVDTAEDGPAAIDCLEGPSAYDLVLLDLIMPGADGLEVLDRMRKLKHRQGVPVVVLAAKGQDADRNEALSLGADDFVTKPFSPKKLLARIEEILDCP